MKIINLIKHLPPHSSQSCLLISVALFLLFTGCEGGQEDEPMMSCQAAPVCDNAEYEVESCSPEDEFRCREVTMCEQTIYCLSPDESCAVPPDALCGGNYEIVMECDESEDNCITSSDCTGEIVYCLAVE